MDLGPCIGARRAPPDYCLPAYAIELRMAAGPAPVIFLVAPDLQEQIAWLQAFMDVVASKAH